MFYSMYNKVSCYCYMFIFILKHLLKRIGVKKFDDMNSTIKTTVENQQLQLLKIKLDTIDIHAFKLMLNNF